MSTRKNSTAPDSHPSAARRRASRGASAATKSAETRRNFLFSPDPDLSGYENLVGACRNCRTTLVVNRATDLGGTYPSAGVTFRCSKCSTMLRVSGDTANHAVDQFIFDAYEPLLRRRYMQCVLMLAQSLELALLLCVTTWLFGHVRYRRSKANNVAMAALRTRFGKASDRMTLGRLRRLAVALAIWQKPPRTLDELDIAVGGLGKLADRKVTDADIAAIPTVDLREAIVHLNATNFVDLRNDVAHKAYRPPQSVAELCYERVPRMNRLFMRVFGVAQGQLVMPPKAG